VTRPPLSTGNLALLRPQCRSPSVLTTLNGLSPSSLASQRHRAGTSRCLTGRTRSRFAPGFAPCLQPKSQRTHARQSRKQGPTLFGSRYVQVWVARAGELRMTEALLQTDEEADHVFSFDRCVLLSSVWHKRCYCLAQGVVVVR
jgi:hypothetical protein